MYTYYTRNGSCVGSDIGWSVNIPIQELTDRQAGRRRRHRFCLWLMHGDFHQLFLQDGSSKEYA